MNLEKAKEIYGNIDTDFFFEFAETVLQELDKSVPKNKLDELVKEMRKDGSNYWANRIEEKMNS